jgi:hypothetical protein
MCRWFLAGIVALSALLAGCNSVDRPVVSKTQRILGQWNCTGSQGTMKLLLEKGGDGRVSIRGETAETGAQRTFDYDLDVRYTIESDKLAITPAGGHIKELTLNGEPVDLAALGGREALERKMVFPHIYAEPLTITSLDDHELALKSDYGSQTICKR